MHGRIAIVINEAGDVTDAQVIAASPKSVEDALVDAAKRAKFQPRKGCGELTSDIFSIWIIERREKDRVVCHLSGYG